MRRKNSLNTSGLQLEYLRTHPLDNNRIAEATDRAGTKPLTPRLNSPEYALFRARLSVLSSGDSGELKRTYLAQYRKKPTVGNSYALALISQRANRPEDARRYLKDLDSLVSANPMVELLRADIAGLDNQHSDDALLSALSELYPDRYSIVEKRLDQLVQDRRLGLAMEVANRYLRNTNHPDALAWRQLASIQERLDDQAGSHESLARYFEALDELDRATSQLELALRQTPQGSQDKLRLEASLKDLREKASSLR